MKITAVEMLRVEGPAPERPRSCRQHRMLHHYRENREHAHTADGEATPATTESAHYVRIRAGSGFGLDGPVDRPAAMVVAELRDFLLGKDLVPSRSCGTSCIAETGTRGPAIR